MSLECYLCTYNTSEIKEICNHLRNRHMLFDGSNLFLKCCAGCPSVLKTYNGFRKHLKKCQQLQNPSSNCEQSYDINNDFTFLSIANDNDAELNEQDDDNFIYTDNENIEKYLNNYIVEMYLLGLPELTITKILEMTSELIFPLLENIMSFSNVDERQNLADKFKYLFQNRLTKYNRNKFF